MRYFTRDKRLIWGNLTVSLMHKADSSPDCFIAVIEDITARKQNEDQLLEELDRRVRERTAELERLSFTDALTGIPNRRSLDQRLIAEWDRAVRSGDPVSVLLIDIDHFKGMNDTLGHAAADRALILVAAELNKVVHRTGDTPARYGGDEFVLLLPGTGAEGALKVARMFQGAIKWLDLANPGSGVAPILTVSQGVATAWPAKKGTSNKLMLAADKALLKAKHGGKNRIEVAPLQKQPERA
jgi:diguanylate cyclase (GGDEF)-like protein